MHFVRILVILSDLVTTVGLSYGYLKASKFRGMILPTLLLRGNNITFLCTFDNPTAALE